VTAVSSAASGVPSTSPAAAGSGGAGDGGGSAGEGGSSFGGPGVVTEAEGCGCSAPGGRSSDVTWRIAVLALALVGLRRRAVRSA